MSLFRRIQESLRADAHGMVDNLADPEAMLRQHLRDAEQEVVRKRARLVELEATWKRLATERERAEQEQQRADADAALAIQNERDDLARYSLKQSLTARNLYERITRRMAATSEEQKELGQLLATQQVALEELRARVDAFLLARQGSELEASIAPVTDEQIELELLRRRQARPHQEPQS